MGDTVTEASLSAGPAGDATPSPQMGLGSGMGIRTFAGTNGGATIGDVGFQASISNSDILATNGLAIVELLWVNKDMI